MSTATSFPRPAKVDVAIGLVRQAWRDLCLTNDWKPIPPTDVVPIQSQRAGRKSGVYRLRAIGDGGSDVVAKRCLRDTGDVERNIYERVLPRIGVPALRYYGYLAEPEGEYCWLFLEEAGEAKPLEGDRVLAARWLAKLHTAAAPLAREIPLPESGPDCYLCHLRIGREFLEQTRLMHALHGDQQQALQRLTRCLDELESSWRALSLACDAAPRTLVHGDFARKNLRVRTTPSGRVLLALDWETAGWGPPAADLPHRPTRVRLNRHAAPGQPRSWDGTVSLDEYAACTGGKWDGRREALARLARVGTVFRCVAGVRWAAEQTRCGDAPLGVDRLCWYATLLPQAIAELNR